MASADLEIRLSTLVTGVAGFALVTRAVNDLENALADAVKTGIDFNLAMESAQTAFTHLLGSKDAAKAFNDELQRQSILTGRSAAQTAIWAQQMVAAGIAANNVPAILRAIEEASALAGKGTTANINGIVLAITQMAQKGKLSMEEVRQQLAERGVNAIQLLAKATGKSTAEINADIEAGRLTANDFLKALISASQNEWSDVLAERAKTVGGALQILGGIAENTLGKIIEPAFERIGGAIVDMAEKAQSTEFQDAMQRNAASVEAFAARIETDALPALARLAKASDLNSDRAGDFGNALVNAVAFHVRAIGGLVTVGLALFEHFGILIGGNAALIVRSLQSIGEAAQAVKEGRFGDLGDILERQEAAMKAGKEGIATGLAENRQTVLSGLRDVANAWADAGRDYVERVQAFNKDVTRETSKSTPGFGPNAPAAIDFKKFAEDAEKWNRAVEDIQRDHNNDLAEHFRRGNELNEDYRRKDDEINRRALQRIGDSNRDEIQAAADTAREVGEARADLADRLADIDRDAVEKFADFEQRRRDVHQRTMDALADFDQRYADRRAEIVEEGDNSPRGRMRQEEELRRLARREARERGVLQARLSREEQQALAEIARDQKVETEKTALAKAEAIKRADGRIAELNREEAERQDAHKREVDRIKSEADVDIAESRRATNEQIADLNRLTAEQVAASKLRRDRLIEDNAELFKVNAQILAARSTAPAGPAPSPVNIQTINVTASNDPNQAINEFVNELERRGIRVAVGN